MAIGPVQLLVLGFDRPDFQGEIRAELERLREDDKVRVIDFLAVYKAPAAVELVRELPKSATGKILKRVLRAQGAPQ